MTAVLEARLYRAAFIPALVVLGVLMFAFEPRPRAAPQVLAADVLFDERQAAEAAEEMVRAHPDRRPGTRGDLALAREVAATLRRRGFETRLDPFEAEGRGLVNVVGRRPGTSRRQVVLLAPRDASPLAGGAASAADTAALLELSRVLHGRVTRKTIVLASVDGGSLGSVGTRRLVEAEDAERIDAVLALSHAGAAGGAGPPLVAWSNHAARGSLGLWRTAADSVRRERGASPQGEHALGQIARLAAPLGVGEQGPLLERGVEAIRFSDSGELPPEPGAPLDQERLGQLGSAVLRTLTALDRAPRPGHGPETYVTVARQVVPGSALSLLALALLLPPLVAAVDGFARARRRGQSAAAWLPWVVAGAAPWLAGLLAAKGLALLGLGPDLPPAAFPPVLAPLDVAGAALAGVAATVAALAFVAGSRLAARTRRARRDLATSGLGPAVALAVALLAVVTWLRNPWTALVLAPAANAWVVAGLLGPRARRAGATLVLVGLLGPLGVGLYYLDRLELGPLGGAWYAFALLVGGHVGPAAALLGALWLGALLGLVLVTGARIVQREPQPAHGVALGQSVRAGRGGLVAGAPRRPVARHEPGVASRGRPR